jgi:hypothetical protein
MHLTKDTKRDPIRPCVTKKAAFMLHNLVRQMEQKTLIAMFFIIKN